MSARYCTLHVGDLLVGIPVDRVQEILVEPEITPVPLAPAGVLGLISRRGEIVTVFDARFRLGTPGAGAAPGTHAIVRLDGETVSLAVDGEGEVVEVDAASVQEVPETVPFALRRLLDGVVELPGGRLMVALRAEDATAESAA